MDALWVGGLVSPEDVRGSRSRMSPPLSTRPSVPSVWPRLPCQGLCSGPGPCCPRKGLNQDLVSEYGNENNSGSGKKSESQKLFCPTFTMTLSNVSQEPPVHNLKSSSTTPHPDRYPTFVASFLKSGVCIHTCISTCKRSCFRPNSLLSVSSSKTVEPVLKHVLLVAIRPNVPNFLLRACNRTTSCRLACKVQR